MHRQRNVGIRGGRYLLLPPRRKPSRNVEIILRPFGGGQMARRFGDRYRMRDGLRENTGARVKKTAEQFGQSIRRPRKVVRIAATTFYFRESFPGDCPPPVSATLLAAAHYCRYRHVARSSKYTYQPQFGNVKPNRRPYPFRIIIVIASGWCVCSACTTVAVTSPPFAVLFYSAIVWRANVSTVFIFRSRGIVFVYRLVSTRILNGLFAVHAVFIRRTRQARACAHIVPHVHTHTHIHDRPPYTDRLPPSSSTVSLIRRRIIVTIHRTLFARQNAHQRIVSTLVTFYGPNKRRYTGLCLVEIIVTPPCFSFRSIRSFLPFVFTLPIFYNLDHTRLTQQFRRNRDMI